MLHRLLLWAAALAFVWSLVIATTGGFTLRTPWFDVSSRQPLRPLIVGVMLATLYVVRYRRYWHVDLRSVALLRLHPSAIAASCAGAAVVFGIHWGTFIGGGPDASGYVSQADRWVCGELIRPTPEWARNAWWVQAELAAAPVGYRPGPDRTSLVPTYSPGLPLMMAIFQQLGGREAVFLVVPLAGGLAIWFTYVLGRRLAGTWAGVCAAILLLGSPPFLWFVIEPMSDVPATAAWAAALAFAWQRSTRAALLAGIGTAAAVLIRPNLVPLAAVPALMLLGAGGGSWKALRHLGAFSAAPACAAVFIATLNASWYGSPLRSGYGTLSQLYAADRVWTNVQQYTRWLIEWQTPLIVLGLIAPLVLRRNPPDRHPVILVTVLFPLTVLALYAPYLTFDRWHYLRFLLPAFPALAAGAAAVLVELSRRSRFRPVQYAVAILIGFVAVYGWSRVVEEGVLQYASDEQRFLRAAEYAKTLPPDAILVSLAHSGTLNFYAGRDVLRWEALHPPQLDRILNELRRKGHSLFFFGDRFEVTAFRLRFPGAAALDAFVPERTLEVAGVIVVDLNTWR